MSVLDQVRPTVDATIERLAATKFVVDPVAGAELSRITSIVSSAYKRHGAIIEVALFHAIAERNDISAENKVKFYVNRNASSYVEGHNVKSPEGLEACLATDVPYREEGAEYELDIVYYDHNRGRIVALEVKRGNGQFDRGKRDSMIKSALTVRTLLRSYAHQRGWLANEVESRIVAYYGVPQFPPPIYLRGRELNHFIGAGIEEAIEQVNDYFRDCLHAVVGGKAPQGELFQ
ncbi:MAG: hypothetical protein AAGK37_21280 [Pseudomonadota bacterium]